MHQYYKDIIENLGEPKWFDENAVPRYCDFDPMEIANIYAKECALYLICCQGCGRKFLVCSSYNGYRGNPIKSSIESNCLHYGDPPNICCCGVGPSMNCEDLKVLQYWFQNDKYQWERDSKLEIYLDSIFKDYEGGLKHGA